MVPVIPIFTDAENKLINKIYSLREAKFDFTLTETIGTAEINYSLNGKAKRYFYFLNIYNNPYQTDPGTLKKDALLIREICKRVRSDIKHYLKHNPMPRCDMDNFMTSTYDKKLLSTMVSGDVVKEIDINACYWTLAYQKGYISLDTFRKFLPFKKERLIALGALAKVKYKKTFIRGRQKNDEKIRSKFTPFFFSLICDTCSIYDEINKAIDKKIFYFKTDAFLVPPSIHIENKIANVLSKYGLGYKTTALKIKQILPGKIIATNIATREDKLIILNSY